MVVVGLVFVLLWVRLWSQDVNAAINLLFVVFGLAIVWGLLT